MVLRNFVNTGYCLLLICLSGAFCSGQCATGFSSQNIHCAGPHGCEDDVLIFYPIESQYGVRVATEGVDCCGQLITTSYGYSGCQPRVFRVAGMKEQLAKFAETSEVLVADCSGRYVLYDPNRDAVRRNLAKRNSALVNDHILR